MRSSFLVAGLLATALALSACGGDPPQPPDDGAPTLTESPLAETTVGASYSASLGASGGKTPYTFSAQGLPPGLSLNSDSGALSGSATAAGDFQVQVTVKGANDKQASKAFALKVYPGVAFKQSSLPQATAESPYSATLEVEGGKAPLTLKVAAGDLPASVSFNATSKQLSGTFPSAGTFTVSLEATDVHGAKVTQSYTLTVAEALRLTTTLPGGNVGQLYSGSLTASGGRAPLAFSLESGALPAGLTLSGGVLAGTPTIAGRSTFTVKVTDANGASVTATVTLDIYSHLPPRLPAATLPNGIVGKEYSETLLGAEGAPPYTFAVTSGSLPAGLSLSSAGVISGTPTTVETQSFLVTLTDSQEQKAQRSFTLVTYSQLVVQTSSLTEGYQGQFYNQTLVASGGKTPYRWEAQGTLPPGLTLTTAGILSGTPTQAGSYGLTFSLTDASGQLATGAFQLTLYTLPSITNAALADGAVGVAYNQRLRASGGKAPYTFAISGGVLPPGIQLTGDTLNGTPTSAVSSNITVQVTDANGKTSSKDLDLRIFSGLTITTGTLDDAYVGLSYAITLTAVGGDTSRPYTWAAIGALPPGLTLSSAGVITGTATSAGTARFTLQVTDDSAASTTRVFDLRVLTQPSVTTASLPEAFQGGAYSTTLSGADGLAPYQWRISAGTLPGGLSLSSAGVLSGTPTTAGTSSFTVELTDSNGVRATRALSLTVSVLAITSTSMPDGYTDQGYAYTLTASGGPTPYTWNVIGLPSGLSYDTSTGVVSGTPAATATTSLSVRVTDALNRVANRTLSLTVYAPPKIDTTALAEGFAGAPYTQPLEASNGKPPLVWSVSGALHTGLAVNLNAGTWAIRGTPTETGTRTLAFQITDANGRTASRSLELTITGTLVLATTTLADAYEGTPYDESLTATGGRPGYTFDRAAGALPGGLALSSAGRISGTVAAGATTSTFTARVTDANSSQVSRDLSIAVYQPPTITTVTYPEGYTGEAYSGTTTTTGGKAPLTFSLVEGAQAGLSLNPSTGELSGTPSQTGTFTLYINVSDANGRGTGRAFQLSIHAPLAVTTPSPLPGAYAGLGYTATLAATGGKAPLMFSLASGTLPAGLGLSADSVRGTVDASVAHATLSAFNVRVTDANGRTAAKAFELTTYKVPEILSTSLTTATEGVSYRRSEASPERLEARYGQGALTYAAAGLPPGLSLSSSTGELSGTPAQGSAGSYNVTFTVTDADNKSAAGGVPMRVVTPRPTNFGGVVGLAPAGSRITDTLTVFTIVGGVPRPGVGVRVRKNGLEYAPPKEALTNAEGKVVLTGLGLNGTTDTVDVTANGQELVNATMAKVNASLVTLRMYPNPVPGPRALMSSAYDPTSRRFLITGGFDSSTSNSIFYTSCLNDTVEAVDVAQKTFNTRVPGGLTTSPSPRIEASMAVAGGVAVLFGGRNCIDTGDSLGDTWEFNLATNTWSSPPSAFGPWHRRGAAMVREPSGNSVLMVGGFRSPSYSNEVWRYTPATDTWTLVGTAPFSRAWIAATANTLTGELWFCGGRGTSTGDTCHSFNPTTQSWTARPSFPQARSDLSLAFDPVTGNLYAFGGRDAAANPFGDLLVLRTGATAWESVIPPGATPAPRSGHVSYFDLTRGELVVALGTTRNPATFVTSRLGDLWTYDGNAWTERGTPTPTLTGYTVSGTISNGPVAGEAMVRLVTSSGFFSSTRVPLDGTGRGTYAIANVPPGEAALMNIVGTDPNLEYPNDLWSYTDAELPPLTGNVSVNHSMPPGPAVVLRATGQFLLPASWRGQPEPIFSGDPYLDVPGFPYLINGGWNSAAPINQFDVAWFPTAAPKQQRMIGYASSQLACEDHGFYGLITPGNHTLDLGAAATALSPGQPECVPAGPRGVGLARSRSYVYQAERATVDDLDGDTFPDLVLPYLNTSGLSFLFGTPSTTSTFAESDCCDVAGTYSVAVGDFNKDGKLDLAATEFLYGRVSVKLGTNVPRIFGPGNPYAVGPNPTGIATMDVDQDGFLDLLVANQGSNTVSYLRGQPGGSFSSAQTITLAGTAPRTVIATHLDGDNRPDLVVLVAEGLSITLDGSAQGLFGNSTLVTAGPQPSAVVVGLLNGDTLPDLAVTNGGGSTVSILLGAGGGAFAAPVNTTVGTAPAGLVLAELTGDAHQDLAVTSPFDGFVTLLRGASNGTFAFHSLVAVPGDPHGVVALDFNQDGLNDLAVLSPTANGVFLLLGQRPLPVSSGSSFSFNAPAKSAFMWSMHRINGMRRFWDYHSPLQPGPVSYSLPLPSTLAPSAAPTVPSSGKVELTWTPYIRQWEPNSARLFNPRQFSLSNLGHDADTQPGASHYLWP
ncbi:putative Ig domain-containing protein [Hyalangium sp.]|uniref:putative Ig domain-containing protein n=1 Tax=Hyalangium sp. TaxID=2028555 RepID=UPI002D2ED4E7|nr:putative Ig domain-containing protein [Hyalangium sp.]HYH95420.1 putative Ig domain-containing protein [Hyalangium sp.]